MIDQRISKGFGKLLERLDIEAIERDKGVSYGLWSDLRLAYFNPSWFRFAQENGGEPAISREWGLGRSIMDCVPGLLTSFYETLYASVFVKTPSEGPPVRHEYECSSPYVLRRHLMTLYRLGHAEGVLVVNSSIVEVPPEVERRQPHEAVLSVYAGEDGHIRQCANCRRIKNMQEPDRWDWIPPWVAKPPDKTTHTLCSLCLPYYYPELRKNGLS